MSSILSSSEPPLDQWRLIEIPQEIPGAVSEIPRTVSEPQTDTRGCMRMRTLRLRSLARCSRKAGSMALVMQEEEEKEEEEEVEEEKEEEEEEE